MKTGVEESFPFFFQHALFVFPPSCECFPHSGSRSARKYPGDIRKKRLRGRKKRAERKKKLFRAIMICKVGIFRDAKYEWVILCVFPGRISHINCAPKRENLLISFSYREYYDEFIYARCMDVWKNRTVSNFHLYKG